MAQNHTKPYKTINIWNLSSKLVVSSCSSANFRAVSPNGSQWDDGHEWQPWQSLLSLIQSFSSSDLRWLHVTSCDFMWLKHFFLHGLKDFQHHNIPVKRGSCKDDCSTSWWSKPPPDRCNEWSPGHRPDRATDVSNKCLKKWMSMDDYDWTFMINIK